MIYFENYVLCQTFTLEISPKFTHYINLDTNFNLYNIFVSFYLMQN